MHDDDRPTLPAWCVSAICTLTEQIERLASGRGCRECQAAGTIAVQGRAGISHVACGRCDGSGFSSPK